MARSCKVPRDLAQDQHVDVGQFPPQSIILMALPSAELDTLLTSEPPEPERTGRSPRRSFRSRISDSFQRVRGRSPSPSPSASPNATPSKRLKVRDFIKKSLNSREPHGNNDHYHHQGAHLDTAQYYVPEHISDWLLYDGSQVRGSDFAGPPQLAHPGALNATETNPAQDTRGIHGGEHLLTPMDPSIHADCPAPLPEKAHAIPELGPPQVLAPAPSDNTPDPVAKAETFTQAVPDEVAGSLNADTLKVIDDTIIDHGKHSRWEPTLPQSDREWNKDNDDQAHTDMEFAAAQDDAWRVASPSLTRRDADLNHVERPGSRASNGSESNKQQGILSAMMRAPEGAGLTELMNRVAPPAGHKWLRGIWPSSAPEGRARSTTGSSNGSAQNGIIFRGADVSPSLYSNDTDRFPDNVSVHSDLVPSGPRGPSRASRASRTNTISSHASTVTRHSDDEREAFERKRRSMLQARNILEQERRNGASSDFRRISGESQGSGRYSVVPYRGEHAPVTPAKETFTPDANTYAPDCSEAQLYANEYRNNGITAEYTDLTQYAFDEQGNQYAYDENGNLYSYDEQGNKYVFDKQGFQVIYDVFGNQFAYDPNGVPCEPPVGAQSVQPPQPSQAPQQEPQPSVQMNPTMRRKQPPTEAELARRSVQMAPPPPPQPSQPPAMPSRTPTPLLMPRPESPEAPPGLKPDGFGGFVPKFDDSEAEESQPKPPAPSMEPKPAATAEAAEQTVLPPRPASVGPARKPTIVRHEKALSRVPSMRPRNAPPVNPGPPPGVLGQTPSTCNTRPGTGNDSSFTVAAEVYTMPHAFAAGQHSAWTRDMATEMVREASRNGHRSLVVPGATEIPAPAEPVQRSRSVLEQLQARGADVTLDAGTGAEPKDLPLSVAMQEIMVRFYSYERFSVPVLRELDNRLVGLEHWVITQNTENKWTEESVARVTSDMRREMRTLMHGLKEVHDARIAIQNIAQSSSRKRKHSGGDEAPGKRIASASSAGSNSNSTIKVNEAEAEAEAGQKPVQKLEQKPEQKPEKPEQKPEPEPEPETMEPSPAPEPEQMTEQKPAEKSTAEPKYAPPAAPPTPPKPNLAPAPSPLSQLARTLSNRTQAQAREQEEHARREKERKQEREEQERKEKDRLEREEQARQEERQEKERLEREEQERKEKERLEQERLEQEQERQRLEREEQEAREREAHEERLRAALEERLAAERAQLKRELELERQERERLERELSKNAHTIPPQQSSENLRPLPVPQQCKSSEATSGLRARAQRYLQSSNNMSERRDENTPIGNVTPEIHKPKAPEAPKAPSYEPSALSASLRRRVAMFENARN